MPPLTLEPWTLSITYVNVNLFKSVKNAILPFMGPDCPDNLTTPPSLSKACSAPLRTEPNRRSITSVRPKVSLHSSASALRSKLRLTLLPVFLSAF